VKGVIGVNDASVQAHLSVMQGTIARMATNSSSCKTWCVTLASAILVVVADKELLAHAWIAACPILVFALLDTYYLALEKRLRGAYNEFVRKAHEDRLQPSDLFAIVPVGGWRTCWDAARSFSVWGCYTPLLAIVVATAWLTR